MTTNAPRLRFSDKITVGFHVTNEPLVEMTNSQTAVRCGKMLTNGERMHAVRHNNWK